MSATAFQRRRRELAKEKNSRFTEESSVEQLQSLTKEEIKEKLDELGIEYKSSANKNELIALLKGTDSDGS